MGASSCQAEAHIIQNAEIDSKKSSWLDYPGSIEHNRSGGCHKNFQEKIAELVISDRLDKNPHVL